MSAPEIIVHRDGPLLAKAVAARLVTRLVDAVAAHGTASLVLTGGGIGTAVLAELAAAPGPGCRGLAARGLLVGRRAVPAGRAPGAERDRRPGCPARPRRHRSGPGASDAPVRRPGRRRPGGGGGPLRGRAAAGDDTGRPWPGALVRRPDARHRPGGPHRVAVPGHAGAVRRAARGRGARCAQAAAHPPHADPARDQHRPRDLDSGLRRGEGGRGARWPCPMPGRCRFPPPRRAAASGLCSCSTGRRRHRYPRGSAVPGRTEPGRAGRA